MKVYISLFFLLLQGCSSLYKCSSQKTELSLDKIELNDSGHYRKVNNFFFINKGSSLFLDSYDIDYLVDLSNSKAKTLKKYPSLLKKTNYVHLPFFCSAKSLDSKCLDKISQWTLKNENKKIGFYCPGGVRNSFWFGYYLIMNKKQSPKKVYKLILEMGNLNENGILKLKNLISDHKLKSSNK